MLYFSINVRTYSIWAPFILLLAIKNKNKFIKMDETEITNLKNKL